MRVIRMDQYLFQVQYQKKHWQRVKTQAKTNIMKLIYVCTFIILGNDFALISIFGMAFLFSFFYNFKIAIL